MQFLIPRNCIKAKGVGFAGKARLAHEIKIKNLMELKGSSMDKSESLVL